MQNNDKINRIGLGTVQFGLDYGVANRSGQVSQKDLRKILSQARNAGIDTLDTAIAYGNSEERLGEEGVDGWRVVTKLPPVPDDCLDVTSWVNEEIELSLSRLNVNNVSALLLHRPTQLLKSYGDKLWSSMRLLKESNIVNKIGFSIYEPAELDLLWDKYQPDIIQSPYNILDQRLKISGWIEKLKKNKVEVHVRSVFMQGLLLLNKQSRPEKFNRWNALWRVWDQWLYDENITPFEACLSFVNNEQCIDRIVVGVDNPSHLQELIGITNTKVPKLPIDLSCNDEELLNPARWGKL